MGRWESPLMVVAAIVCCALPDLVIFGGTALLTGAFLQQSILIILGLFVLAIGVVIYADKKK